MAEISNPPSSWPFPFLGDDRRHERLTLWLITATSTPEEEVLETVQALGYRARLRSAGHAVWLGLRGAGPPPQELARKLHARVPLLLAVREGPVHRSAWHEASLFDRRVLSALETMLRPAKPYLSKAQGPIKHRAAAQLTLLEGLKGHAPRAELLRAVLHAVTRSAAGDARRVMADYLIEHLPLLIGFDFEADLVVCAQLAELQKLAFMSIPMPEKFRRAFAERTLENHNREAARTASREKAPLWTKAQAVREAMRAGRWAALADSFDETNPHEVRTLLSLRPDERVRLAAGHGSLATRIANAATHFMMRQDFARALTLYDAAVEGSLDPRAAANPLYAVQSENSKRGIDRPRARHYLDRCLPFGRSNPVIFLNGAFLLMELDDRAAALEALTQAAAHGVNVAEQRNEPLFASLHGDPAFESLMPRAKKSRRKARTLTRS